MNFAQIVDAERVREGNLVHPAVMPRPNVRRRASDPDGAPKLGEGSKRRIQPTPRQDQLLKALGDGEMTRKELIAAMEAAGTPIAGEHCSVLIHSMLANGRLIRLKVQGQYSTYRAA